MYKKVHNKKNWIEKIELKTLNHGHQVLNVNANAICKLYKKSKKIYNKIILFK